MRSALAFSSAVEPSDASDAAARGVPFELGGLHGELFGAAAGLPPAWDEVSEDNDYLRRAYLVALEAAKPTRIAFRYALLFRDGRPVLKAAYQELTVPIADSAPVLGAPLSGPLELVRRATRVALGRGAIRMVICGNALVCAPGFAFETSGCSEEEALSLVARLFSTVRDFGSGGAPFSTVFILKDVRESPRTASFVDHGFLPLPADPPMTLSVDPSWRSLADYLGALTGHYRRQYTRVREAGRGLVRRSLSSDQILAWAEPIDALHAQVTSRARLLPTTLSARGFAALKASMGPAFELIGYFEGRTLVAFNTRHHLRDALESYQLGLDYGRNRARELYRNTLLDDVEAAIDRRVGSVRFGRTSQEMKSALGAQPEACGWFARHAHGVATRPLIALATTLLGAPAWVQRHPFRSPR